MQGLVGGVFVAVVGAGAVGQELDPPARALALELSGEARLAGTCGDLQGAKVVRRHLEAAGWTVEFDEHEVVLSLPRRLGFAVFADGQAKKPALERVERFDPDAIPCGDVPLFNAWSASGKVRGKVVDVGFGLRADYERLKAAGVDVRGCIALARYGRAYRGVKAQMAEEFGCAGVLLFSESKSDGGEKGAVWPAGPWKPDWEAQRGSILPVALAPGDPSTPLWGAPRPGEPGPHPRLSPAEIDAVLPRIPCLPIGARDASAILMRLASDELGAPLGPGPVEVALDLEVPRELRTIRNVIGTLPGADDQLVILGSHRDAWVRGANDSGSGCVALLRAAQHLGERARSGWKPQHTLKLAFWDAEEFGLIGSTEFGEANAELLKQKCLAYVNSDASVSGLNFGGGGSPGMLGVLKSVCERVRTADGAQSLWQQWSARSEGGQPKLGLPGAGSDDAVFVHHLCIPVLDAGFGGNDGGQYHTRFDDFPMMERYLDPGFVGHELAGRFLAELASELATRPHAGFDVAEAALAMAAQARALAPLPWTGEAGPAQLAAAFEQCAAEAANTRWSAAARPERFYAVLQSAFPIGEREWFNNALWAPALDNGYGSETFPHLRYVGNNELDRRGYFGFLLREIADANAQLAAGAQPDLGH